MNHEKIFVRPNGDKVKIDVSFFTIDSNVKYPSFIKVLPKGKRNWLRVFTGNPWEYSQLPYQDRKIYIYNPYIQFATTEEIQAAKLELWEKLKPV